ncbi:MAG: tetratricopeptide repeat protein [Paludibacteraceae bacterium]|nr:tetratricopeptide repeat protein [Paludibacteraceae bacterium]
MKIKLLTLTFFLLTAGAWAQQSVLDTHPKHLLETGLSLYAEKNYPAASRYLESALETHAFEGTESERMAKSAVALSAFYQQKDDAAHLLEAYAETYPYASNMDQVQLYRGILELEDGKNKLALDRFASIRTSQLSQEDAQALQYYRGLAYSKQKKYDKAAYEFGTLLKTGAGQYQTHATYHYGYAQYQLGNYAEALKSMEQVKNSPQFKANAKPLICQLYFLQNQCDKATVLGAELVENAKNDKKNAEILRIMGICAARSNQHAESIAYLERYQKVAKRISREDWYVLGMAYFFVEKYENAVKALAKTTGKKDRLTQNAYYHTGVSYLKLGDKKNARMAFEQASRSDFDNSIKEEALYNYALITYEMSYQPFNESVAAFERFLKEFPNSQYKNKVYEYLVNSYLTTTNYSEAYKSIQNLNTTNKTVKEAEQRVLFGMATNAIANRQYAPAMQYLETIMKNKSYNDDIMARTYFWYGECLYRSQKYPEAQAYFEKYLKNALSRTQDEYNLAYYNLAYSYFVQNKFTESNNWFRQYVNQEKENTVLLLDAYNRIGDAYFHDRDFTRALEAYGKTISMGGTAVGVDYALYQKAFVQGLQRKYEDKVATLATLQSTFPKSAWIDDAMYETARSYTSLNNNTKAIAIYRDICGKFAQNSDVVRKAKLQIAMLQYNEGQIEESINMYKQIIAQYPNSEEAATSFTTLESMMVDNNRVDEYNQLAQQLGKSSTTKEDSLQYKAVEKIYFRDDFPAATSGFEKYLTTYPQGKYNALASYYLANCYYRQNKNAEALAQYKQLVSHPENPNLETTLARAASLSYDAGAWADAATYFDQLAGIGNQEHKQAAALGLLRCYYMLNDYQKTISAANDIVETYALQSDMVAEARYNRMKAYLALNKPADALADIKALAKDTRSAFGAEAKYYLAKHYLDNNQLDKAEAEVFDYIDKGTDHQHWLAKAFVVLADVYMGKENYFEAKQYLLSLQDNYDTTNDAEVAADITNRLKKIESYENETVSNN